MERFINISGATKVIQYEDASVSLINGAAVLVESSVALDALVTAGVLRKESNVETLTYNISSDHSAGLTSMFGADGSPFKFRIVSVSAEARATVGSGSVTLYTDAGTVSNMVMDTDKVITSSTDLAITYSTINEGDDLFVDTANVGDRGVLFLNVVKITG